MRKGVTEEIQIIQDILATTDVLWLALIDQAGPYCVPVNFAEQDGTLYLHMGKRGRKYDVLMTGTPLAFSAASNMARKEGETACDFGYRFNSVMGSGTPLLLEGDEAIKGLDIITTKFAGKKMPFNDKAVARTAVFAIDVDTITGRIKE